MSDGTWSEQGELAKQKKARDIRARELHSTACKRREAAWEFYGALRSIRDEKLYKELGHASFEKYAEGEHGVSYRRAKQLIDAVAVVQNLNHGSPLDGNSPTPVPNERQARALAPLSEEAQLEAWEEAVETAPNGKVTAKHVESVVAKKLGKSDPQPASITGLVNTEARTAPAEPAPEPEVEEPAGEGEIKKAKPGAEVFGPNARREANTLIGKLIRILDKTPFWPKAKPHTDAITDIIDGKVAP